MLDVIEELLEVADAMADGTYWDDDSGPDVEYQPHDPSDWG